MTKRTDHGHGLQYEVLPQSGMTTRERAERLYLMGELAAAAELLLLEAIQ